MPVGDKRVEFQSLDKPEGNKRFADIFKVEFNGDSEPTISRTDMGSLWQDYGNNKNFNRKLQYEYVKKSEQPF